MIVIPLENEYRIRRGINGCWVLEKYIGKIKKNEVWQHKSTCRDIKNLFIRMIDHQVALADDKKSILLEIQKAYDDVAEKISKIDISQQYESTLRDLEDKVRELTIQNYALKAKVKKDKRC